MGLTGRLSSLGGRLRTALAGLKRCCCGCPEECLPCVDCCYDTESPWPGGAKLRVTVETLECRYPSGYDCLSSDPEAVYSGITRDASFDRPQAGSFWPPYPPNMLNWGDCGWVLHTESGRGYPGPVPCEWFEPVGPPDEYVTYVIEFNCETKHWYIWGSGVAGGIDIEYTDLGEGDCGGIAMTSFVYVDGYECSAGKMVTMQLRVQIEVIDNDECMAV